MSRQVSGSHVGRWQWLRAHPRRAELIALVTDCGARLVAGEPTAVPLSPGELTAFLLTPDQVALVCWDAVGVRARLVGQSYRQIAEYAEPHRSYETWRMVCRIYLEYSDDLFANSPKRTLRALARSMVTEPVIRAWSSGKTDTNDVAVLLGDGVSASHALYWIRRRAKALGLSHVVLRRDAGR